MNFTYLGRTGLRVSRLCLGTMNFGPETDEPTSFAIMDRAHEVGINFFDSANVYGRSKGRGATEEIVGRWFAQGGGRRERTVLATKLLWEHGRMAQRGAAVGAQHPPGLRRLPAPTADRLHRPLPDAPHRPAHALGRDLGGHGGAALPGQDPLRRFVQLRRLAHRQSAGRGARPQVHGPGQRAVPLQPARPSHRAGGPARGRRLRGWDHPVVPPPERSARWSGPKRARRQPSQPALGGSQRRAPGPARGV